MFKSIRARLTLLYALSATVTTACLFGVGYLLLETRLVHGLDLLNEAEFNEIRAHLGNDYEHLSIKEVDQRIRRTTEYASVLFYVNIDNRRSHGLFYSSNLNRQVIPDVPGQHIYNTRMPRIGELRVQEFVLNGFDVTIATPLASVRTEMRTYVEVIAGLLFLMLLASVAIGLGVSRAMLTPIRAISETANRIRHDNLGERIPVGDVRDEVSDLARLLNQVFDHLQVSVDQSRRFAADASHELKTPLSLMRLHLEKLLVEGRLAAEHEDVMLVLLDELGRLNRFIDDLLFLSRAEANAIELKFQLKDPQRFLDAFNQDALVLAEHQKRRFVFFSSGSGIAAFEERWLRHVLLNLLTNALNASPEGGLITLRSSFAGDVWRVSLEDEGPGLTADQRAHMFDRFVRFTNMDGEDRGSGLGLAICRSVIALHRGHICAEAGSDGRGLRVTFELPIAHDGDRETNDLSSQMGQRPVAV